MVETGTYQSLMIIFHSLVITVTYGSHGVKGLAIVLSEVVGAGHRRPNRFVVFANPSRRENEENLLRPNFYFIAIILAECT